MIRDVLYKDCQDMPLVKFVDMLIDGDLAGLVKTRGLFRQPAKILKDVWADIYEEFNELNKSVESKTYLVLTRNRAVLRNKIFIIQTVVASVGQNYCFELACTLKTLGFNYSFSRETIVKDLKAVLVKVKGMKMDIAKIDKQLLPFLDSKVKIAKKDFIEMLTVLSKHQGYNLDLNKITVAEYAIILNNYKEWLTIKKSQK